MTPQQLALWQRLESFEFDEPGTQLRFAARLARENGWSVPHSERVLREYKRFCFLALEAGHPATPSEDVDQAWHLHLCYTRSYWEEFCPQVLRTPLHHGPTKGGAAEAGKHDDWYRRTLASYERLFGEKPPADVWPDSETRFSHDIAWKRVNQSDHWIVPKPKKRHVAPLAIAALLTLLVGCANENPLHWKGPDFLALYAGLLAAVVATNLLVRFALTRGHSPDDGKLGFQELAYLQGGKHRLFLTVMTDLTRRGHLNVTEASVRVGKPLPQDAPPIEAQVVKQIERHSLRRAAIAAAIDWQPLHESLADRGLVVPKAKARMIAILNALPLAILLAFGIWKITIGMEIKKPVEFLVVLSFVTFFIGLAFLNAPFLTGAGKRLMKERRARHIKLKGGAHDFDHSNPEVPLAVALYGVAALELGAFGDLRNHMKTLPGCGNTATTSSGGCTSSSSDGGGDGGGGGGCGGCGGGGGD